MMSSCNSLIRSVIWCIRKAEAIARGFIAKHIVNSNDLFVDYVHVFKKKTIFYLVPWLIVSIVTILELY